MEQEAIRIQAALLGRQERRTQREEAAAREAHAAGLLQAHLRGKASRDYVEEEHAEADAKMLRLAHASAAIYAGVAGLDGRRKVQVLTAEEQAPK